MEYEYVKMLPWVGERYAEAEQRVMVVGVKMYSPDPCAVSDDATTECVDWYLRYHDDSDYIEGYFDTYDRMIDIVRGENEDRETAWRRVIFYNFTQEPITEHKGFPNEEQLAYGNLALKEMVRIYKPDKILVMGKRLYDSCFIQFGKRAQNYDKRTSWMVNINEIDEKEESKTVHMTYFNDPSHVDFDLKYWRETTQQFLLSVPTDYTDPQNKRRLSSILNYLQIDYKEFVTTSKENMLDVLAKAVNSGVLHLVPEVAIAEIQRVKATNVTATAYFASQLRLRLLTKDSSHEAAHGIASVVEELLMVDRFDVQIGNEGSSITFNGKKKSQVKRIYNRIMKLRLQNKPKHIEWEALERLFGTKNLRQYLRDVRVDKDYIKEIDNFFINKEW